MPTRYIIDRRTATWIADLRCGRAHIDEPDPSHRMPRRMRCESCLACIEIDKSVPSAGTMRRQAALGVAGTPHRIEYYPGVAHGFVFALRVSIYNPAALKRHRERLFSLFERAFRADG